jgi:hypothetical protein
MEDELTHNKEADGFFVRCPVLANRKLERRVQWLQINARRDMIAFRDLGDNLR